MPTKDEKSSNVLLIGAGNLGEALLDGMLKNDIDVAVSVRTHDKQLKLSEYYPSLDIRVSGDEIDITGKDVILAVKPNTFYGMTFVGDAKSFTSVMAKVPLCDIKDRVSAEFYARAMPNIAAKHEKSVTAITGDEEIRVNAVRLFSSIGRGVWVDSEDELNIATALAGSGPAFLALVAEAMIDGAVRVGLKRALAEELTEGLFDGFTALLESSKASKIKEDVMSPKGTTAAGLFELESNAVRASFMKAVEAAYVKASKV